jgi:hypothetical protein
MWFLLVATALAAPPDGVDLEDLQHWGARSDALLDGPPGCWEIEGEARVRVAVFTSGGFLGKPERVETTLAGPWSGRLEDGLWVRLDHQLETIHSTGKLVVAEVPVHPMVGQVSLDGGGTPPPEGTDDDGDGEHGTVSVGMSSEGLVVGAQAWSRAANLVDELVAAVDPDTVLVYASWSDALAAVQVVQTMPLGSRASAGEVVVRSTHPVDGGPERLDMSFPDRIRMGEDKVKVTLMHPQLHLVAVPSEHGPLPARESLSTILGVLGFTLGYEQELAYHQATPCR